MVTSTSMVTMGEAKIADRPAGGLNAILYHNLGLYPPAGGGSPLEFAKVYKNMQKMFTNGTSVIEFFQISEIFLLPVIKNRILNIIFLFNGA